MSSVMRPPRLLTALGLAAVVAGAFVLWMLPVVLAGDLHDVPPLLLARNLAASGRFVLTDALGRFVASPLLPGADIASADARLTAAFAAALSRFIAWGDLTGWAAVSAAFAALSLVPFWFLVSRLLDRPTTWAATVLFALLPVTWTEALWLDGYSVAYFFLFLSGACVVALRDRAPWLAVGLAGLCFGAAASAKDAFLVFVLWIICVCVWLRWPRGWRALGEISLFGCTALVVYLLPYLGDIRELGYPVNHNLAFFWPGATGFEDGVYLHLYPDPYTYFFNREAFESELLARYATFPFLQQMIWHKVFLNFGVGDPGAGLTLLNSLWLAAGVPVSFLHQDTLGGPFLLLFAAIGCVFLWVKHRTLAVVVLSLPLVVEFLLRFVLHYSRLHIMDYAWVFAIVAAVGVRVTALALGRALPRVTPLAFTCVTVLLSLHLLQVNRALIARAYARTPVPEVRAVAEEFQRLPADAVVAVEMGPSQAEQIAFLSDRTVVIFRMPTVEDLLQKNRLGGVFTQYGVTHVFGYDDLTAGQIAALTSADIVAPPAAPVPRELSPVMRLLLHIFH